MLDESMVSLLTRPEASVADALLVFQTSVSALPNRFSIFVSRPGAAFWKVSFVWS